MRGAVAARCSFFLVLALGLNVALWTASSDMQARWGGVPPVPSERGAQMMGLGDSQFAYRLGAILLQNIGNTAGQEVSLRDYDYKKVSNWLWLLNGLDPASNDVPMVAAYYFGGTRVPEDVAVIVEYLATIGQNPVGNKWRWLAHSVFLARHRMKDLELALDLAYRLSRMQPIGDNLPIWARQMPAFVLTEKGDKQAARKLVENMLKSQDRWHANEISFMKGYLVDELGVSKKDIEEIMKQREDAGVEEAPEEPKVLPALMP